MYYRRKILLSLLQLFEGKINNLDFQKYLFLFNEISKNKYYHFVPYKYGCFSFQSYADKRALIKYNILGNEEFWLKNDTINYIFLLSNDDKKSLYILKEKYGHLRGTELIKYLYKNYPYYAINSEIAEKYLNVDDIKNIQKIKNFDNSMQLFTIGYEGRSIDEYVNQLVLNNIKLLCDVRKNAISMKYGFSKTQLKETVEKLGIEYLHVPELGVESSKRKVVDGELDYKKLFSEYYEKISKKKIYYIEMLNKMLHAQKRIALTCFELDYNNCHRYILAKLIKERLNMNYIIMNI